MKKNYLKLLLIVCLAFSFLSAKKKRVKQNNILIIAFKEILYTMNTDPLFDGTGECTTDEIEDNFCLPFKVIFLLLFSI